MRISSSWLTLGASLSLLIPAWTANAQEFTMPLRPFAKVILSSDLTKQITSQIGLESIATQYIEIIRAKPEQDISQTQPKTVVISETPKTPQKDILTKETPTSIEIKSPERSPSLSVTSSSSPTPQTPSSASTASTTEPARVSPSSITPNSGTLEPAQTLVVPTTPSQVKLDRTKPITLNEVIELVERTSPDWIQARIAVDRARAGLQSAEAGRSPTVAGSAQYSFTDSASARLNNINNNSSNNTTSQSLSGTVGINYNIFDSGVNDTAISAAEKNVRIAEANLNQVTQTIRLNIVSAYYNLQNTDETIRIQRKAVENSQRSLKDTKSRERAGVGTKFDVLQAEVSLANSKQDLLNAEASQLVARRELSRQINYPPTIEITAADKIEPVAPWKLSLEDSILLAVRNRAELDIQRLQREVARDNAQNTLARLGPQVSVFANLNAVSDFAGIASIGTGYQLGAKLDWNLYDGGRAAAQVDQFKADQATAESRFEQAARQARFDVESAYINQRSRFQQIETATGAVQQAEEALRLARLRLDAGVGTQLEVITAESDFTRADVNRVQAIIGYNQSRANLERAISGL